MMYQTHLLGGAVAGLASAHLTGASLGGAAICAAFGALLPDIDTPQSKGAMLLRVAVLAAALLLALRDGGQPADLWILGGGFFVARALPWTIGRVLGHRGPTHSAVLVVLLAALALTAVAATSASRDAAWVITFVTVGYVVGGLGLDACTIRGIPLLWPLHTGCLHLLPKRWRIRTAGGGEVLVRVLLGLILILALLPLCHALWSR